MAQKNKDRDTTNVNIAHEMVLETLGFHNRDHIVPSQDAPATPETSRLAYQLGSIITTLIVVCIIWFLIQGF
jgi:hypothetical protein